jgi:DNA-binding response OmpR family regulator
VLRRNNVSKILIIEDDPEIAMLEKDYLEIDGFEAEIIADGTKALEQLFKNTYDLILLDLMLPSKSGYDICREIRNKIDVPIIMVTAKTEPVDKIRGLGIGADDYIAKPFDPAELVARVKAHINRYSRLKGSANGDNNNYITVADLRVLPRSWKVYKGELEIKFPNREFELLLFLAENPNIVFSKEQLFEKIWGYDFVGDSATVTVHINRIRDKIEDDPAKPKTIETVWGAGYRLNN